VTLCINGLFIIGAAITTTGNSLMRMSIIGGELADQSTAEPRPHSGNDCREAKQLHA
jgi:hypothetical protein